MLTVRTGPLIESQFRFCVSSEETLAAGLQLAFRILAVATEPLLVLIAIDSIDDVFIVVGLFCEFALQYPAVPDHGVLGPDVTCYCCDYLAPYICSIQLMRLRIGLTIMR